MWWISNYEIEQKLRIINSKRLDEEPGDIESKKSEAIKYHEAGGFIQRMKKNKSKIVSDHGMIASNDKEQCEIIRSILSEIFVKGHQH